MATSAHRLIFQPFLANFWPKLVGFGTGGPLPPNKPWLGLKHVLFVLGEREFQCGGSLLGRGGLTHAHWPTFQPFLVDLVNLKMGGIQSDPCAIGAWSAAPRGVGNMFIDMHVFVP